MIYLSIGELIETHERGDFETVAKQALMYGEIVEDRGWSTMLGNHYREVEVVHHNVEWVINKRNGRVTSITLTKRYD